MQQATVIDLGNSTIAAAHVSLSDAGNVRLEGAVCVSARAIDSDGAVDANALAEGLQKALDALGPPAGEGQREVHIAVGGTKLTSMRTQGLVPMIPKGRRVASEDLLKVIQHSKQVAVEAEREVLQSLPRRFRIDGETVESPIGVNASRLEVDTLLVTSPAGVVAEVEKAVSNAGMALESVVAGPLATALGSATAREMQAGCAVVDLGERATGVTVFSDGSASYVETLRINSRHITTDVQQLLKVDFDEAERLKQQHSTADNHAVTETESVSVTQVGQDQSRPMQRRVLCEIVGSRAREIATQVKAAIERDRPIEELSGGIILAGGGSALNGIAAVFEREAAPAKIRIAKSRARGETFGIEGLKVNTILGLAQFALQGADSELEPAGGAASWKDRIRTLTAIFGGKE